MNPAKLLRVHTGKWCDFEFFFRVFFFFRHRCAIENLLLVLATDLYIRTALLAVYAVVVVE